MVFGDDLRRAVPGAGHDAGVGTVLVAPPLVGQTRLEPGAAYRCKQLDYDIVLDGEIWLELDDGVQTLLTTGDVAVQCGTRHAWRNKSKRPTTMVFVLIGASRR